MYVWLVGALVVLVSGMAAYTWHHQNQAPVQAPQAPIVEEVATSTAPAVSTDTSGTFTLALNETGESHGWSITPLLLVSDSRCPVDVQCIQAGTVEVRVRVGSSTEVVRLAEPHVVAGGTITLVKVTPDMRSTARIAPSGYRFSFLVTGS